MFFSFRNSESTERIYKVKSCKKDHKNILQIIIGRSTEYRSATSGEISILISYKGNIHSLMPNEFTQLVAVFKPAYKVNGNYTNFSYYSITVYKSI
jgi:hypothetical protein